MTGISQRMAANNRLQSASAAKQRSTNVERALGMPLPCPFRPPLPVQVGRTKRRRRTSRRFAAGEQKRPGSPTRQIVVQQISLRRTMDYSPVASHTQENFAFSTKAIPAAYSADDKLPRGFGGLPLLI